MAVRETTAVLVVDDNSQFAELTATFLERVCHKFTVRTATSAVEGLDCLANRDIDCVVSDYDMPNMNGLEFLTVVREEYPTLPFILFTGKGSEEIASEAISTGVTNYLQKRTGSERFELLANQIGNAVERARAERALERTQMRFRALTENTSIPVVVMDDTGILLYVSEAIEPVLGYTPGEVIGDSLTRIMPEQFRGRHTKSVERYLRDGTKHLNWDWLELPGLHRDGHEVPLGISFGEAFVDGEHCFTAVLRDITERKTRERELERSEDLLNKTQRMANVGGWEYDLRTNEVQWTDQVTQIHELPPEFEPDLQSVLDLYHPADVPALEYAIDQAVNHGESYDLELRLITANDDRRWVRALGEPYQEGDETVMLRGTIQDVTDRKGREQEIEKQQAKMKALHTFATDIQSCRTKDEVYELTIDAAERILNFYLCYVGIAEDDSIVPKACLTHAGPEYVQTMATDEGIAGKTLQTGTSYLIEDVAAVDEAKPAREDYRSAISVPLGDIGVFQAVSKEVGGFNESDLELVEIFLAHVVATLKNV